MEKPDQTFCENKIATFSKRRMPLGTALTPMEQRIEDERQTFDVRRLMQLEAEGKPFLQHLDNSAGLGVLGKALFSPRGLMMFRYLEQMQFGAKDNIRTALVRAPLLEALADAELVYWWGYREQELVRLVNEWNEHARTCEAKGEPIPTPAYWLLKNKPPTPFKKAKAILEGVQHILANFVVDGQSFHFSGYGKEALQGRLPS